MKVAALLCLLATSAYAAPVYYVAEVRVADEAMSKAQVLLKDEASIQYAMSYARGVTDLRIPSGELTKTDPLVLYISRLHECSRVYGMRVSRSRVFSRARRACIPVFGLYSGRAPH